MAEKENDIAHVLQRMMQRYRLTAKFSELELKDVWEEIAGALVAKHTTKLEMRGKTLYVWFDQAPLKNEMFLRREQLMVAINDKLGAGFIEKIFIG